MWSKAREGIGEDLSGRIFPFVDMTDPRFRLKPVSHYRGDLYTRLSQHESSSVY